MTIVLLGAQGQLANDLRNSFAGPSLVALDRAQLDIADEAKVRETLMRLRPAVVLNTAAYNRVDDAEEQTAAAFAANALALHHLSRLCHELNCVLVHYSTDYVFGRSVTAKPWTEADLPAPLGVYGISKLCGEQFVGAYCQRHFIIRTSGLFGFRSDGTARNFVETILSAAKRHGRVRVVNDQTCGPSYTADIAEVTSRLLETSAYGLYHVTNGGQCTWYEFAAEILRRAGSTAECLPISSADYGARAVRPPFSVLSNEKLAQVGVPQCPRWQDGLARYFGRREALGT